MGLNENQIQFINEYDKNVLLTASAGTGKTTTMIKKLGNIISQQKVPVKNLLIVTYTVAAANEMQQKLYNELKDRLLNCEDQSTQDFLSEQINDIQNCEIGTIHSVCKRLIKKYFYIINIDPSFNVVNDGDEKFLFDTAINKVFLKYIESDDKLFYDLFETFNYTKRDDQKLKKIIKKLYIYLETMPDKEKFIKSVLEKSYNEDLSKNICDQYLLQSTIKKFNYFKVDFAKLLEECDNLGFIKYNKFITNTICYLIDCINSKTFKDIIDITYNFDFFTRPTAGKKADINECDFSEELKLSYNTFKKIIDEMIKFYKTGDIIQNIQFAKNDLIKLFEIVQVVYDEYSSLKIGKGVVDFSDLEHYALKILHSNKLEEIKQKYKYIFVDEYQDVNQIQEDIILLLSSGNNLFMIGDIKQSIYAFRQSSPEIFINKFNEYSKINSKNKAIPLNENFRSREKILQFANNIFGKIILTETIGIDYNKNSRFTAFDKDKGDVDITILDKSSLLISNDEDEANTVVSKVKNLLQSTYILNGIQTKYLYKDICILSRKISSLEKLIFYKLQSIGIPCNINARNNYFDTFEIQWLMSFLKIINNPLDEISLVSVLTNKPFLVSLDEIAKIRLLDKNLNMFLCLEKYKLNENYSTNIDLFFNVYNKYLKYFQYNTLFDSITKFLYEFDLINYFESLPSGAEIISNINVFLNLLRNKNYEYSVVKFLEYISYINDNSYKTKMGVNDGVVIETIHASKGLEFPAVILVGIGNKFQINLESSDIIFNKKYGVGIQSFNYENRTKVSNIICLACKNNNIINEINEEIRLFYVAITRAKYSLNLIGTYNLEDIALKNIYQNKCYFDFIINALNLIEINNFKNKTSNFTIFSDNKVDANILTSFDNFNETKNITMENTDKNLNVIEKLKNYFDKKVEKTNIPLKNSVTSILKEEVDYENTILYPLSYTLKDCTNNILQGADFGIWYHSVCKNFTYNESDLEISKIVSSHIPVEMQFEIDDKLFIRQINTIKKLIDSGDIIKKELEFLLKDNYNNLINFANTTNKIIVQGVIDLVIIKPNGVIVVDFKTNKNTNKDELIKQYKTQLDLYKRACELGFSRPIIGSYIYSVMSGELIKLI